MVPVVVGEVPPGLRVGDLGDGGAGGLLVGDGFAGGGGVGEGLDGGVVCVAGVAALRSSCWAARMAVAWAARGELPRCGASAKVGTMASCRPRTPIIGLGR